MSKTKLFVCVNVFLLTLSGAVFAAGGGEEQDTITVGFSVFDMRFEFFQQMEKGTRKAVEERGWKYILHDQKSDAGLMVSGIQDLINQNIDLLLVSPYKPEALGGVVQEAHNRGIPVVINDIGGGGTPYDAIIVSNNAEGGRLAAKFALDAYDGSSREAAIIKMSLSQVYASTRGDGFKEVMEDNGYTIVKELFSYARSEEAYKIMQDILVAHPNVKIVFAENDTTAAAASQAARDAGVTDILFIGFDATEVGLASIENNTMGATIMQLPYKMGEMAVDTGEKILNEQAVQFDKPDAREIHVNVELITIENINDARSELK